MFRNFTASAEDFAYPMRAWLRRRNGFVACILFDVQGLSVQVRGFQLLSMEKTQEQRTPALLPIRW